MSYHTWLLLAVMGWLTGEPVYSQQPAREPSAFGEATVAVEGEGPVALNQETENENDAAALPALEGIEAALRDLVAEQRQQAGLGPEDHELRDLHAQEAMAFWAKLMFYAALASVIITAVGVELVRRTLKASREGVRHANSAADAAWKTVEQAKLATDAAEETTNITRDIGRRQLRAYVTVDVKKGLILNNGQELRIHIILKNTGQTPAKNVRNCSAECIFQYRPPQGIIPPPEDNRNFGSESTIAVGDNLIINKVIALPPVNELIDLQEENHAIHIFGSVFYEDIFDETYRTNFFFWIRNGHLIEAIEKGNTDIESCAFSRANQWNNIT